MTTRCLKIPLLHGWSLSFGFGTNDSNHHGKRIHPDTDNYDCETLRSTYLMVPLGKGYNVRHMWGRRLWFYRKDGSCWYVQCYVWNGKQHGVIYD